MYRLYWSDLPEVDDGACTAASENATLRENPNCLFWSACGLEKSATGYQDWLVLDPNIDHAFEVILVLYRNEKRSVGEGILSALQAISLLKLLVLLQQCVQAET